MDATPDALLRGVILSAIGLLWLGTLVRIVGLRTLSKMTALDFVATLATGSLLASMVGATNWNHFFQAGVGATMINGWQYLFAKARRSKRFRRTVENQPVLLMRNGQFLDDALRDTRISRDDVLGKLRENNVSDFDRVDAVVLEVTGDISVLTGAGGAKGQILPDVEDA